MLYKDSIVIERISCDLGTIRVTTTKATNELEENNLIGLVYGVYGGKSAALGWFIANTESKANGLRAKK